MVAFGPMERSTISVGNFSAHSVEAVAIAIASNTTSGYGKGGGDNYALNIFGKPAREANCDCERTTDPTLLQTIYTRNDPAMLGRLEGYNRSGWMDEVRNQFGSPGDRSPVAIREKLANFERKIASAVKEPEKPAKGDAGAGARYEEQLRQYENRVAEVNVRRGDLEKQLADAEKPQRKFDLDAAISEVFLRTVSRPASADEFSQAKADVAAANTPVEGIRDLLWAMLNTREFMVNH